MRRVLSIYANLPDKKLNLPDYLRGKKFIISLLPIAIERGTFSTEGVDEVRQLLHGGCLLGQRGYSGRCRYAHDKTDPWHENSCLYHRISYGSQLELMIRGRQILRETFGTNPIVYAPVNHLYNEGTLAGLQVLGYQYMMDQNNFSIPPYKRLNIMVIPETRVSRDVGNSHAVHAHVDELRCSIVESFIMGNEFILPTDLEGKKANRVILKINEIKKRVKKLVRDYKKTSKIVNTNF